jgi:cytochrome P450
MLARVESQVQEAARAVIDAVAERGACDFVTDIAAALPLKIICDMMGIPDSEYGFVFDRTNLILGAGDPEYVSDPAAAVGCCSLRGPATQLVQDWDAPGRDRRRHLGVVNPRVDGDSLSDSDLGSFFVLLVVATDDAERDQPRHEGALRLPRRARALDGRLRGRSTDRGRGDRPLGDAGHALSPHRDP